VIGGIPNSVDQIVLHSLAKGRDERYQTAADFRADVEAARGGRQISAAVPVMHGSNATTQFVPMQDPTGTRVAPAGMGAAGGLLGQTAAGGQAPADQYGNPYTQDQYAQDQYNRDQYNRDQYNRDQYGQDDQGRRQQGDRSGSNWKMILAGLAVVIVVALVGYLVVTKLQEGTGGGDQATATVEVPGVVNQLQSLATDKLKSAGFVVEVKKETSTADQAGKVTGQKPGEGESAEKGSTVVITVGSGPNTVPVPDLSGMTEEEAIDALKAAKLKVGTKTTVDDPKIPKGHVVRSEPPAEDEVARNSKVDLVLASGTMEIPDLTNKTEGQAKSALKKLGFKVKIANEPAEVEPGRVSRTDPEAGNSVSIGSTVTVFISQPGDPTTEPEPSQTDATPPPDSPTPSEPSGTSSADPSSDGG
jgi:serine/threonine-protein kinase